MPGVDGLLVGRLRFVKITVLPARVSQSLRGRWTPVTTLGAPQVIPCLLGVWSPARMPGLHGLLKGLLRQVNIMTLVAQHVPQSDIGGWNPVRTPGADGVVEGLQRMVIITGIVELVPAYHQDGSGL